ncbi:MAG: GtrA family protein [Verrucomicrobia bacterium]|nr:GtrA family protein [Verrucomicrobiota bacterium]
MQFVKFGIIGASGVLVDMGLVCLLADPACLGLDLTVSKVGAAEGALTSNFVWNEVWTFREAARRRRRWRDRVRRFVAFNGICGVGIGIAVACLHLFHTGLGFGLYESNGLAILAATGWNFVLNARFNWRAGGPEDKEGAAAAAGRSGV